MDEKELMKVLGLEDEEEVQQEEPEKEQKQEEVQQEEPEKEQKQEEVQQEEPEKEQKQEEVQQEEVKEASTQDDNNNIDLREVFKQYTGEDYNPSNPEHVILVQQIALQIEQQKEIERKQKEIMNYLQSVVDKEFDNWLTQKMQTLPFSEVAAFQQALQTGDLDYVKQFIEKMKKQFVLESDVDRKTPNELPQQGDERSFSHQSGDLDDIVDMILNEL